MPSTLPALLFDHDKADHLIFRYGRFTDVPGSCCGTTVIHIIGRKLTFDVVLGILPRMGSYFAVDV